MPRKETGKLGGVGLHRWVYLGALMLAGECIYMLPYMRKTFQSSMEAAFGVTSTQLGTVNSVFGILALVCYFPGGWLADRLPARHLLSFSLFATGAGGFYLMTSPGYAGLLGLHAFWGVTSILTFWAALIKATRDWGGSDEQGRGFGLLDGGRGVVAALLASLATWLFATGEGSSSQLMRVLWVYSLAPILAGVIVWFVVPGRLGPSDASEQASRSSGGADASKRSTAREVARIPEVWLLAVVIFTAYWLFVGSFEFPAYAELAYDASPEFAATLGTFRDWMRPVAAIGAGFLADRFRVSRVIAVAYVALIASYSSLWVAPPSIAAIALLWVQVSATALAVFALRGVYYALMEEQRIPRRLTGTTVGVVSVIGFLPDTFAFVVSGAFADAMPDGGAGYRAYFGLLAIVAVAGLAATAAILWRERRRERSTTAPAESRERGRSADR